MENPLVALRASVDQLHTLVGGLDDDQLVSQSYCDGWSIAQVLSHLGSGAVISLRGLQDVRAGTAAPDGFNQSVWDEWNAKSPRDQAEDALVADEDLTEVLEAIDEAEQASLTFSLGPLSLGFNDMFGLRLNEHVFHTWDIAVMFDGTARLPGGAAGLVVDNLALIARFTGRPDGQDRTIAIRTTDPERAVALRLSADGVELSPGESGQPSDLVLPAEAFGRLVYGRLDPAHTPEFTGDAALLDTVRLVFPGP